MRGTQTDQPQLFSYVSIESRIPRSHPLRAMRARVDEILGTMSVEFDKIYSKEGRPSVAPEHLLKALLLQVLYTIRSERQLVEQLDYNMLFRWFVGLGVDDAIWTATTFSKNRKRLLEGDIAEKFFAAVVRIARKKGLVSSEHYSVDGTLIEAWASLKSFQKREDEQIKGEDEGPPQSGGRNQEVDFKGEKRSNSTHESKTDPEARLFRKSQNTGAQMSYMGHALMENRNGLAVDSSVTQSTGLAEREAAVDMLMNQGGSGRKTLAADKGYDEMVFVEVVKKMNVTPHVAQNQHARRASAIDDRTTRHPGYRHSMRVRKRIEEIFGWLKTVGGMRKTRHRGRAKVAWQFTFALSVYNLVRIGNLCPA